jgi:hypothetical protein
MMHDDSNLTTWQAAEWKISRLLRGHEVMTWQDCLPLPSSFRFGMHGTFRYAMRV